MHRWFFLFVALWGAEFLALAAQDVPPRAELVEDFDEAELLNRDLVTPAEEKMEASGVQVERAARHERALSESGQFSVTGGEAPLRASIALQADDRREQFIRLVGPPPERRTAMEILLVGKNGDPPRARALAYELRHTAQQFVLRIHVDLSRGVPYDKLEEALLSGLLMDRALATVPLGELERPLRQSPWLVAGTREALRWQRGNADRRLYESLFKQGGGFPPEELLGMGQEEHERLDGVSREIFRAQSGALVMAMLGQPQGREAFAKLCSLVPFYEGEVPLLLREEFPAMNLSEKSLAKWWALTLAKLSDAPLTEILNIQETDRLLTAALSLAHADQQGRRVSVPIERWRELPELGESARVDVVRPVQEALNHLSYRCFPSYRPLLVDYQAWLAEWARTGDSNKVNLAELAETRTIMLQRGLRARDYLDYIEIREASELSGSFDDYLRLKEQLKERKRSPREDALSRYLDTLEAVYRPRK